MPYSSQAQMQVHALGQVEDVSAWRGLWSPVETRLHLKEVTALRSKSLLPRGNTDLTKKGLKIQILYKTMFKNSFQLYGLSKSHGTNTTPKI